MNATKTAQVAALVAASNIATPATVTVTSLPELATCSVADLEAVFRNARNAVAEAKVASTRATVRTAAMTLAFTSLLGR